MAVDEFSCDGIQREASHRMSSVPSAKHGGQGLSIPDARPFDAGIRDTNATTHGNALERDGIDRISHMNRDIFFLKIVFL